MPSRGAQPEDAKPKRKRGQPTLYDPARHPIMANALIRQGLTLAQLAAVAGVHVDTVCEWMKQHPEFSEAVKGNVSYIDDQVEDSLLKRALGYEYEEVKTVITGTDDATRRQVERTKKRQAPDVTACIFWLKNRRRDRWRDKHDLEHTGADGGPIEVAYDPRDELLRRVAGLVGAAGPGEADSGNGTE